MLLTEMNGRYTIQLKVCRHDKQWDSGHYGTTAKHLDEFMRPKPLEIIYYHCQQAAEKMLKGVFLSYGANLNKTHDLDLLAEQLNEFVPVENRYFEICDNFTPYDVTVRYPQELYIEEQHIKKALCETEVLLTWLRSLKAES